MLLLKVILELSRYISHRVGSPLMNALSRWRKSASQPTALSIPEFTTTPPESPRQTPVVPISTPSSVLPLIFPKPERDPLQAVTHSRTLSWASWWRSSRDKDATSATKSAKTSELKDASSSPVSLPQRSRTNSNASPGVATDPSLVSITHSPVPLIHDSSI